MEAPADPREIYKRVSDYDSLPVTREVLAEARHTGANPAHPRIAKFQLCLRFHTNAVFENLLTAG